MGAARFWLIGVAALALCAAVGIYWYPLAQSRMAPINPIPIQTPIPTPIATPIPTLAPTTVKVPLAEDFNRAVASRLVLPQGEVVAYAMRLHNALDAAQLPLVVSQFVLLVDRSPNVQAALLYWGSAGDGWSLVGAAPVSTGLPGRYEHFVTPLGIFDHSMANPDFRSAGTKNKLGFRGYGQKGLRVYDFGWVESPRGWGDGAMGVLRFQMHSTDPGVATQLLGTAQSEGCVRIPAALNDFMDRHAVLDQDYERASAEGKHLWVLRTNRQATATPGRYMVVVDSAQSQRPAWSPLPAKH